MGHSRRKRFRGGCGLGGILSLTAEAVSDEVDLLGKYADDLQSDIVVRDENAITGTLKYVTGYTGFSGDPALQSGHYIALQFDATEGTTVTVELIGGTDGPKPLDSDLIALCRITDVNEKIKVVCTGTSKTMTRVYDLTGLVLEEAS